MDFVSQKTITGAMAAVHDTANQRRSELLDIIPLRNADHHDDSPAVAIQIENIVNFGVFSSFDDGAERTCLVLKDYPDRNTTAQFFPKESKDEIDAILMGNLVTDAMRAYWKDSLTRIRDREHDMMQIFFNALYDNEKERMENMRFKALTDIGDLKTARRNVPYLAPLFRMKARLKGEEVPLEIDPDAIDKKIKEANQRLFASGLIEDNEAVFRDLDAECNRRYERVSRQIRNELSHRWMNTEVDQMTLAFTMARQLANGEDVEFGVLRKRWQDVLVTHDKYGSLTSQQASADIHNLSRKDQPSTGPE